MTQPTITVDDASDSLVLGFVDDHGDATGLPAGDGSGLVAIFASDNPAVATVGDTVAGTDADGNATLTAPVTMVAAGAFNASVTLSNSSGAPLTEADGTTPFPTVDPVAVPVVAGPAAAGELSIDT